MALAAFLQGAKRDLASLETCRDVHIVLGNESCDLDSVVCSLAYAFFLHSTSRQPCPAILPVLNVPQCYFRLRLEVNAHLASLNLLPHHHLIFIDDPSLDLAALTSRADVNLTVTLVDHHQLSEREECVRSRVVDVLDHRPLAETLPDSWHAEIERVGSCATLVTHRMMDHGSFTMDPVSAQLLLGAILADTGNLSERDGLAQEKDHAAVSRLERSLPAKVTCQGIYDLISKTKYDLSGLSVGEMLRKDLKIVKGTHITVALSSVTMDMELVLSRPEFAQHATSFCADVCADVLLILTVILGEESSISQRCIAVYSSNRVYREQITDVLLRASSPYLNLQPLTLPQPLDHLVAFNQSNLRVTRKGILPLIGEFLSGEADTPDDENGNNTNPAVAAAGSLAGERDRISSSKKDDVESEEGGGGGVGEGRWRREEGEMQMRRHINMAKVAQSNDFRTSQDVFDLAAVGTHALISPSLSSDSACDFDSVEGGGVGGVVGGFGRREEEGMGERGESGSGGRKITSSLLSSQVAAMEKSSNGGDDDDDNKGRQPQQESQTTPSSGGSRGDGGSLLSEGSNIVEGINHRNDDDDDDDDCQGHHQGCSPSSEHSLSTNTNNNNTTTTTTTTTSGLNLDNIIMNAGVDTPAEFLSLPTSGQISAQEWGQTSKVPSYPETPPNSYTMSPVVGQEFSKQTHLPSFNSREMVEKIHEKKKAMNMMSHGSGLGRLGEERDEGVMSSSSEFGPSLTVFGSSSLGHLSAGGGGSLMSPVVPSNSYTSCGDIAGTFGQQAETSGSSSGLVDIPSLARAGIEEKVSEKRSHFNTWSTSPGTGSGDFSGGPYTPQNSHADSGAGSMIIAENLTSLNSAEVVARIRAKQAAMFGGCSRASGSSEDSMGGGYKSPGGSRGISLESPVHAFTPQNSYKDGLGVLDERGKLPDLNEVAERLSTEKLGRGRKRGGGGGKRSTSNSGGESRDDEGCGGGGVVGVGAAMHAGIGITLGKVSGGGGGGSARHSSSQSDSQNTMSDVESLLSISTDVGTPSDNHNIVAGSLAGMIKSDMAGGATMTPKDDVFTPGQNEDRNKVVFGFNNVGNAAVVFNEDNPAVKRGVSGGGGGNNNDDDKSDEGYDEEDEEKDEEIQRGSSESSVRFMGNSLPLANNNNNNNNNRSGGFPGGTELFSPLNEGSLLEGELEMYVTAETIVSQSIAAAALQMNRANDIALVNGGLSYGHVDDDDEEDDDDGGECKILNDAERDGQEANVVASSLAQEISGVSERRVLVGDGEERRNGDSGSGRCNDLASTSTSVVSAVANDNNNGQEESEVSTLSELTSDLVTGSMDMAVGSVMASTSTNAKAAAPRRSVGFAMDYNGEVDCNENPLDDVKDVSSGGDGGNVMVNCVVDKSLSTPLSEGHGSDEKLAEAALSEFAFEWAKDLIQGVLDDFPLLSQDNDTVNSVENGNESGVDGKGGGGGSGGGDRGKTRRDVPRLSIVVTDESDTDGFNDREKRNEDDDDDEEDVDGFSVEALDGSVGDVYREEVVDIDDDDDEDEGVGGGGEGNNDEEEDKDRIGSEKDPKIFDEMDDEFESNFNNSNTNAYPIRKWSRSSSSSADSAVATGERKWSREVDVSSSTIRENEVVTTFPERNFHDIDDYDDSPITSFPGRKISISEDYPRRHSREDSRRQSTLVDDQSAEEDDLVKRDDLETEYLPSMDPLHGNLDIVSNESSFPKMTDSGREVVEGESFRRVSGHELVSNDNKGEGGGKEEEEEFKSEGERAKKDKGGVREGSEGDTKREGDGGGGGVARSERESFDAFEEEITMNKFQEVSSSYPATRAKSATPPIIDSGSSGKKKKRIRVSFSEEIMDDDLEFMTRPLRSPPPPLTPPANNQQATTAAAAVSKKEPVCQTDSGRGSSTGGGGGSVDVGVGATESGTSASASADNDEDDIFHTNSQPSLMHEVYMTSAGRISIAGEEYDNNNASNAAAASTRIKPDSSSDRTDPLLEFARAQVGGLIESAEKTIRQADKDVLSSSSSSAGRVGVVVPDPSHCVSSSFEESFANTPTNDNLGRSYPVLNYSDPSSSVSSQPSSSLLSQRINQSQPSSFPLSSSSSSSYNNQQNCRVVNVDNSDHHPLTFEPAVVLTPGVTTDPRIDVVVTATTTTTTTTIPHHPNTISNTTTTTTIKPSAFNHTTNTTTTTITSNSYPATTTTTAITITNPTNEVVGPDLSSLTSDPLGIDRTSSGASFSSIKGAEYRDEWQDDEIRDLAHHAGISPGQARKKIVPGANLRDDIDNDDDEEDDEEEDDVIDSNPDNDLEWENDTPVTEPIPEDQQESSDQPRFRTVVTSGSMFEMDMEIVSPYKAVLSHGGYYEEGLCAIIVFYGYHLPHRRQEGYRNIMNHLFHHVVNMLDQLVADDYVILYFHGSTPKQRMPGFHWLKRCYQCIDRRLKKNLKGLFLVHPTLWLRTVVAMTRPFISSKFSSKVKFVRDLQELKGLVPLENITIPPSVLHYDRYKEHLPSASSTSSSSHPAPPSPSSHHHSSLSTCLLPPTSSSSSSSQT